MVKQELGTVLRRIGERMSDKELKDMVDEVPVIIPDILIVVVTFIIFAIITNITFAG